MSADEAWVWLIAEVAVFCALGILLSEFFGNTDFESDFDRRSTGWHDVRNSASPATTGTGIVSRSPPELSWRKCSRWPKARQRMRREIRGTSGGRNRHKPYVPVPWFHSNNK